jgi:predicted esterase
MWYSNVYALAISGMNLFAGTNGGGVFLSTNNGTSWTAASPGLTNTNVNALAISGMNLFAGTDKGTTLPYRLFIPANYSPSQKYPLVLALHGAGERGTNNTSQIMKGEMATSWADPVNQAKYPCFVVAPQCPTNEYWGNDPIVAADIDLMDSLIREFTIDTNRLYITGLSMGGFGTWDMITRFPNRFAAAIPMSGGGNPALVPNIANTPIWNFHGAQDPTVPVGYSRDMIEALKGIGRTVVYTHCHNNDCSGLPDSTIAMYVKSHADLFYTEYQYGEHGIWDESYDYPLLFPWVFDKYLLTPGAIAITNLRDHPTLKGIETISWQSSAASDSVEIWYSPDAGGTWQMVSRSEPNSGSYQWDTKNFKDGAFELLKVFVKNHEGFIYGRDQSGYFTIDNQTPTSVSERTAAELPKYFALAQNYPNPFNPSTVIEYDLPKNTHIRLLLFDVLGRQVRTLVDEEKPAGIYRVKFDATDLPSGVYLYRLQADGFTQTKKLILSR